jgi:hypothetical protein
MQKIIHKTNMTSAPQTIADSSIKRFKVIKNPTLSFFGPQIDNVKATYWQSHAYDLYEYGRIIDTESFVARAFNKKAALMFKNGYTIMSDNENNAKYVESRLNEMAYVTGKPFDIFLKETAMNLITFHNAYIVKARNKNSSTGKVVAYGTTEREPIAGYFNIPPETVQTVVDDRGKILRYREYISSSKYIEYSPDNVIHIHFNKRTGFLMGTPPLEPVKDDILALRRIEESIETLIYKSLFPIIHVKVGTEKQPAKKYPDGTSEVDIATSYLRNIEDDGGIVTSERVDITAVGAESLALRVEGYLNHFKERVFIGLGMSGIDFGVGDGSGRATGEVLSESLKESVMSYQDAFSVFVSELIIKEILYESGRYKAIYMIKPEDMVYLEFNDLDVASKIKIESHELNKMTQGVQSVNETRKKSGLKQMSEQEVKKMQQQHQYDPNQEAANEIQKQQVRVTAAAKKTAASTSKKKAKGSSNLTKSVAKPKNQHSDFANGILSILDSASSMKRGRLYNYIYSNVIDVDNCTAGIDDKITSTVVNILNMYNTIDKKQIKDMISNQILTLIVEIMEKTN